LLRPYSAGTTGLHYWATSSINADPASQIYFRSAFWGFPVWTSSLDWLYAAVEVSFRIYGICGEAPIPVYVDIKPGSCPNPLNSKSKGVLPVAICGTPDFNVMDIDPETILLAGVPPIRYAYEDVATPFMGDLCDCHDLNGDGYMDLTLKFKTQHIVAIIGTTTDREWRTLTLTGNLIGGEPFEGQDCVWIVHGRGSII
jgi:hypothetical protein